MARIQAPDGSLIDFPDGTPDETITRVMRENFGGPQPTAPAQPVTRGQSFIQGLTDPIQGGAQLLANALPNGAVNAVNDAAAWLNQLPVVGPASRAIGLTPATPQQINEQTQRREADYQASRQAAGSTGTDWMRMAGSTAAALPAAVMLPAGGSLLGSVAAGAGTGALMSAAEPVAQPGADYLDTKKQQIETGGVLGAAAGPLGHMAGRLLAPRIDQNVRELAGRGVQMTPGQAFGGTARTLEDTATSIPFVGDVVRSAQRRSVESFNRATANEVLKPLGQAVPDNAPVGRELIADVGRRIGQVYDDAISRAQPFGPDQQFAQDVRNVAAQFLTPKARAEFNDIVRDRIMSRFGQGGQITPEVYQTVRSDLGRLARLNGRSADKADQELAGAFGALRTAFDDLLGRTNPAIAPELDAANAAYAAMVRMEAAGGRVGAVDGVFTPAQLSGAVREADNSIRHRAYARGDALLQDMSDPARAVLPSKVPDSGSAVRIATLLMAGGGAGATGLVAAGPLAAAGLAGAAYTPLASRLLQWQATRSPSLPARAAGNTLAASGGVAAGPLAAYLAAPPQPGLNQRR